MVSYLGGGGGSRDEELSLLPHRTTSIYIRTTAHLNVDRLIQDSIGSASWARRTPQVGALEHSAPSCAIFISV